LDSIFLEQPVFLVTVCVLDRRPLLATGSVAQAVTDALRDTRKRHGWLVGRYVIMPDHLHFFCAPQGASGTLSSFVGGFKQCSSRKFWRLGRSGRLWQREFHDHLLRSSESCAGKWEYVRMNPVRAGLCKEPEDWPYSGEIDDL
jgi:putative transposase